MNGGMHFRARLIVQWFHERLSANEGPQMQNSRECTNGREELRVHRSLWRMKGDDRRSRGNKGRKRQEERQGEQIGRPVKEGGMTETATVDSSPTYNSITIAELLSHRTTFFSRNCPSSVCSFSHGSDKNPAERVGGDFPLLFFFRVEVTLEVL